MLWHKNIVGLSLKSGRPLYFVLTRDAYRVSRVIAKCSRKTPVSQEKTVTNTAKAVKFQVLAVKIQAKAAKFYAKTENIVVKCSKTPNFKASLGCR